MGISLIALSRNRLLGCRECMMVCRGDCMSLSWIRIDEKVTVIISGVFPYSSQRVCIHLSIELTPFIRFTGLVDIGEKQPNIIQSCNLVIPSSNSWRRTAGHLCWCLSGLTPFWPFTNKRSRRKGACLISYLYISYPQLTSKMMRDRRSEEHTSELQSPA